MFDYRNFDDTFEFDPDYFYESSAVESIETNRRTLEGLFVDKVIKLLGVKKPAKFYPAKSNSDLRALHQSIVDGTGADHTKLALLYYILLDCDVGTRRHDYSDSFEERSFLPKRYQIFMRGLWYMDRLEFGTALQYLTNPSLIPTFHEEILETLVQHSRNNDHSLALAYYHTVQPTLQRSNAVKSLFSAITHTSVTEGYFFCQGQPDDSHRQMFEFLITLVLRSGPSQTTAGRAVELVNLPFTAEEEGWFGFYLTSGDGRLLNRSKDTVMMRQIATGRLSNALSTNELGAKTIGGLSWEIMQISLTAGLGPRAEINNGTNGGKEI